MADSDSDISILSISDDGAQPGPPAGKQSAPSKSAGRTSKAAPVADGRNGSKAGPAYQADDLNGEDYDYDAYQNGYAPGAYGMEDDIGAVDELVEDETKPLGWSYFKKHDPSEGPATWQEVDDGELEYVAESLVAATTKTRDPQGEGVLQHIFQPQAMQDVLVPDPLGRGLIDPHSKTMIKGSKKQVRFAGSGASSSKGLKTALRTLRGGRAPTADGSVGEGGEGEGAGQEDAEMGKVLPNREGFDPEAYLATFHAGSTQSQLEKGIRVLGRELSERTGQLKELILNNFERFISCKDAIDDIHSKLRKMLLQPASAAGGSGAAAARSSTLGTAAAGAAAVAAAAAAAQQQQLGSGGSGSVGTERVVRSLEHAEASAQKTFGPILERAAKADRIRAVTALLRRFDHLFSCPQRVRELASRGELEQVVREYHRANALIRPGPGTARVWATLHGEIEKRVAEVYTAVRALVVAPLDPAAVAATVAAAVALFSSSASDARDSHAQAGLGPAGGRPGSATNGGSAEDASLDSEIQAAQAQAAQLPDYILFMALLRQERLPAALEEDPMKLYATSAEAHLAEAIKTADAQHMQRLQELVTSWMRFTMPQRQSTMGGAAATGAAASGGLRLAAALGGGSFLLAAEPSAGSSSASFAAKDTAAAAAGGPASAAAADSPGDRSPTKGGPRASEATDSGDLGMEDDDDDDEDGAEAALMMWVGAGAATPFLAGALPLPAHLCHDAARLVQDPGGPVDTDAAGGLAPALSALGGGAAALGPLPSSQYAPEPALTPAQLAWLHYVCTLSALLCRHVPGLWLACHSGKYTGNTDLEAPGREALERGPVLARRATEGLAGKYAQRLARATRSLARAGPLQPGLPLAIKDACHLLRTMRRVGISVRAQGALRDALVEAARAYVRLLCEHLTALPEALFSAEDFLLDALAAEQQPVTSLPRRLEDEVRAAMLQYQWTLASAEAALVPEGGGAGLPPDASWRALQAAFFGCISVLCDALTEYAAGLAKRERAGGGGAAGAGGGRSGSGELAGAGPKSPVRGGKSRLSRPSAVHAPDADDSSNAAEAIGQHHPSASASARALSASPSSLYLTANDNDSLGGAPPSGGAGSAEPERGGDVRILLVISNCAVIRSRVMPALLERYRPLLAGTREASGAAQRRLTELTKAMRKANEALGTSYLALKEADIKAVVDAYVASEGGGGGGGGGAGASGGAVEHSEGAGLGAGPPGPSAGCCALLGRLIAVHNEAFAYSPSNLFHFMEALVEHMLEQLGRAYKALAAGQDRQAPAPAADAAAAAAGVEAAVQLLADLQFLGEALRPLLVGDAMWDKYDACQVRLAGLVAVRQRSKRYSPVSAPAAAVAGITEPDQISRKLQRALRPAVASWLQAHALNVRCFAMTPPAAPAAAAVANTTASALAAAPGAGPAAPPTRSKTAAIAAPAAAPAAPVHSTPAAPRRAATSSSASPSLR